MKFEDFPILKEQVYGHRLVYLDNAATSQKPQQVIDAISYGYTHFNANIHRGVHYLSQLATEHHEQSRQRIAKFINAHSANEIIFTKGTTDSINMLARSFSEFTLNEGDEIIVSTLEHHSNIVPWQMVCKQHKAHLRVIPLLPNLSLDIESYKKLITAHTKLITITHISNVLGIVNPIKSIIEIAHNHSIPVLIDAAQSIAHEPIDVKELDCDFMAFSAHKIYGPTGIGILYGKEKWLNILPPAEGGGEMIEHVSFEQTTYNSLPYKFEAGTPNFIGSYAFATALDYIDNIGLDKIKEHEIYLMNYAQILLKEIPQIHIYASEQHKSGVLSFNVYNGNTLIHPFDIGTLLNHQGIAVRIGHHCAEPLMNFLQIPGTIRLSVALYNTKEDIDYFIQALKQSIAMLS